VAVELTDEEDTRSVPLAMLMNLSIPPARGPGDEAAGRRER